MCAVCQKLTVLEAVVRDGVAQTAVSKLKRYSQKSDRFCEGAVVSLSESSRWSHSQCAKESRSTIKPS